MAAVIVPGGDMRAGFWWYTSVAGAAALAYPYLPGWAQQPLYVVASGAAVVAVWWGVRLHRPSARSPWLLLAGGLTCTFAADLITTVMTEVAGLQVAFPSFLDVLYLLFYPLVFLSIGSFLKASGRPDRAAWVDASIWTIGAAAVSWEMLIEPYIDDADAGVLSMVVALAYPLLDLALLLMVLRMLTGRASLHPAYLFLTSAMLLEALTDFVYGVRVAQGTYVAGEFTDVGWMVVSLLLGAAALHPAMVKLTHSANRPAGLSSPRGLQTLLVPALAAPGLLLYQLASGDLAGELGDGLFTAAVVVLIIVMVVIRGSGLLRLAGVRSAELADRSAALEAALDDRERVGRDLRTRVNQDALTGLASRDRFVEILQADIGASITRASGPSVAFLDLDDFKSVNDTLGHEAGDLLLVEIARRLRAALGPDQIVARFGGDEFAILVHGDAEETAEHLVQTLRLPVLVHGREIRPRVSIGVTTARAANCSSSDLLREADVAMYAAKSGGGGWARYQSGMSSTLLKRLDLRDRLTNALQCGDIQPWFQPVVDLDSGMLLGFEALARWCSNGIPILAPVEWLPFAEESGLVVEVDRAMLRSSVAQLAAWRKDAPDSELDLAINLSGRTLQQDGIDDEVIQALKLHGVPAHRLVVEVTEGVLINDARVGDRLRRLRTTGVRIALDDFGTGWASLSYLRHLPVDHLKLDQSFTADLGRQPEADAIPSAIAHLARGLSLGLVAEGVETTDQRQRLLTLGFRVGQGYLFGRAQPPSDLRNHVLNSRPLLEVTIDENPTR